MEKIIVYLHCVFHGSLFINDKNAFKTFFRAQSGNIHDVKGFGLGLSYVKEIIEQHGGNISRASRTSGLTRYHLRELLKKYELK